MLFANLKSCRKQQFPADTQADFARRLGVSRYTYQKMERGDLSVAIKHYVRAAELLGVEQRFHSIFEPPEKSLFERLDEHA